MRLRASPTSLPSGLTELVSVLPFAKLPDQGSFLVQIGPRKQTGQLDSRVQVVSSWTPALTGGCDISSPRCPWRIGSWPEADRILLLELVRTGLAPAGVPFS